MVDTMNTTKITTSGHDAVSGKGDKAKQESVTMATTILGVRLGVSMPPAVSEQFMKHHGMALPAMSVSDTILEYDAFVESSIGNPTLKYDDGRIRLSSLAEPKQFAIDVTLAASRILEFELNKRGIYSLHASAVARKGGAAVLLGGGGAGKTTTALSCCIRDGDVSFVAGERIFVSKDGIVGDIKGIELRKGSLLTEFGGNLSKSSDGKNGAIWEEKALLSAEELGVKIDGYSYPLPIDTLVLVKKLPKKLTSVTSGMDKNAFLLRVYDSLYVFAELLPCIMLGGKLPYMDLYTHEMKKARARFAAELMESSNLAYLEGEMDDMADFILRNIIRK